ncbi:class I SAM-dependent methyltransferase [Candidatus Bathyarchaeota archaeon]|nr:MAG: class I SAM-dependent methyltransferase [Candidatus Bathyarchaeota archaeon]
MNECNKFKPVLDAQQQHWNRMYAEEPDFFGEEASYPAKKAAEILKREGKSKILEIGAGQGRDSLFFAKNGFQVTALDYSETAVEAINQKAQTLSIAHSISPIWHDIRRKLPFVDDSFDACYCHMLYCMALCTSELEALFQEARRVLKPNGISVYTVRHTGDAHYGKGIHRGEDMYENDGFIVHFFSRQKVEHLAKGYQIVSMDDFEEGELPRKLFLIVLKKIPDSTT